MKLTSLSFQKQINTVNIKFLKLCKTELYQGVFVLLHFYPLITQILHKYHVSQI